MSENKKPGVDSQENLADENALNQTSGDGQATSQERRRAVRNILAGSGVVAGAATSGQWSKPIIDAVVLPAHAQTSGPVTLVGNVAITPLVTDFKQQNANDILDFFIGTANAGAAAMSPDLAGSCMTMMVDSTSFDLLVEFASAPSVNVPGTVSNGSLSGSASGISVTGSVNLASTPPTASGQISNEGGAFSFALDDSQTTCKPIPVTTTPEPTTTPDCSSYGQGYAYNPESGYCEFTTAMPPSTIPPTTTATPE